MNDRDVRDLLRDRAEQVHVHGDYAGPAIAGAQHIRRRRVVTAAVAGVLALALPFGLASLGRGADSGPDRVMRQPNERTLEPTPTMAVAIAHVGAPTGPVPVPYIQDGLLHLGGKTVSIPVGQDDRLLLFAALSNGGVVYQVGGPNHATPELHAGPLVFLDRDGGVVKQLPGMARADTDGPGDVVTAFAASGDFVAFDVTGTAIRRWQVDPAKDAWWSNQLGRDLVANLAGAENSVRFARLSAASTAYYADLEGEALTLHEGRTLLVEADLNPTDSRFGCKYLIFYPSSEILRSWCDDTQPIGFSPDGSWMYGTYRDRPGVWVERTDSGARVLEIRVGDSTRERLTGEFPAPSPDSTSLLVGVAAEGGQTVTSSCAITTGTCQVLSDGLDSPSRSSLALPDNWGRPGIDSFKPRATHG